MIREGYGRDDGRDEGRDEIIRSPLFKGISGDSWEGWGTFTHDNYKNQYSSYRNLFPSWNQNIPTLGPKCSHRGNNRRAVMLWLSTLLLLIDQVGYEGLFSRLRLAIVADLMVSRWEARKRKEVSASRRHPLSLI